MFRTIIVGHDGTRASDDALALALQLRDPDGGRLVLAGISRYYHGFADPLSGFAYADWLREESLQELAAAAERIPAGVPFERQVVADANPARALNDLAEALHADLVVLGPTHRGAIGKVTGRTTVQRLLHGAPCAVAVAAPGQDRRFGPSPRIVVAYDGSAESETALATAYGIAARTRALVTLVHVVEPIAYPASYVPMPPDIAAEGRRREAAERDLVDACRRAPESVAVEHRVLGGPAAETLLDVAEAADLLVTGSRHYGVLHRAIVGSVAGALLTDGHVPVLVTPRTPAAERERSETPLSTTAAA